MQATTKKVPARLYKYKAFDALTLELIVSDKVYFSDPTKFNDPLDTSPHLAADMDALALQALLQEMLETRNLAEMEAAANAIKARSPETLGRIERLSRKRAQRLVEEIAERGEDPDSSGPVSILQSYLEDELLRLYNQGILSLAARHDCPLMWSHYGQQHHGLCMGYEVPDEPPLRRNLYKVSYGGSRLASASRMAAMIAGDEQARKEVEEAVLTRKARDWRYEREWRLIGPQGLQNSPLELREVIFGTRCSDSVKHSIAKALLGRDGPVVRLFEMRQQRGTFKLKRCPLDVQELGVYYPTRALSALEGFEDVG